MRLLLVKLSDATKNVPPLAVSVIVPLLTIAIPAKVSNEPAVDCTIDRLEPSVSVPYAYI